MTDKILKDLKDTYKRTDILLPSLERHVLKKIEDEERRSDIMHPSEMAKSRWCGRHDFYRITGQGMNYKEKKPSFRMSNVWDYGHSVHRKYQTWLWEMGILWGAWKCKGCEHLWLAMSPEKCPECSSERLRYREVPLSISQRFIEGHSDGVVMLIDGEYAMIEIKSIGINSIRVEAFRLFDEYQQEQWTPDELWWRIKRPFAAHLRQGTIYLWLARQRYPELDLKKIIYIYEWKPTQEVKEFVIEYNPEIIKAVLETAEAVSDALRSGESPDRPPWANAIDEKGCKDCEYRRTCWGTAGDEEGPKTPALRVKRVTAARRRALRS